MAIFSDYGYSKAYQTLAPGALFVWEGFEATAINMQAYWDISVERNDYDRTIQLRGVRKRELGEFISDKITEECFIKQHDFHNRLIAGKIPLLIHIRLYKSITVYAPDSSFLNERCSSMVCQKILDVDNKQEYKVIEPHRRQQIIVDPDTVSTLLAKIKKIQQPKIDSIIKKKILSETSLITLGD